MSKIEEIRKNAEQQQAKMRDAQAQAKGAAGVSAQLINHRMSCQTCKSAVSSKGLCAAGLGLWEHVMGRQPKNLIR